MSASRLRSVARNDAKPIRGRNIAYALKVARGEPERQPCWQTVKANARRAKWAEIARRAAEEEGH